MKEERVAGLGEEREKERGSENGKLEEEKKEVKEK